MMKEDDNLLDDFENTYLKRKKHCRYCLIISSIIVLLIIIIAVLYLLLFLKTVENKEIDNISKDNPFTLDTIPEDDLNSARNSFHQYYYNDGENPNIILPYNLFIPENYTKSIKYPLILFIGDETTYGKEITLTINKTIGGPIWATKTFQNEHNCFVLIPQFDKKEENTKNEYLSMLLRLINKTKNDFNIDSNRIYGIGQSIGADVLINLLKNNSILFSSIIIINGINLNKEIISQINTSFLYFASEENLTAFNIQIDIKNYLNIKNITFASISNINPKENVTILNQNFNDMFNQNYIFNFITFSKRNDYDSEKKNKINEIKTYKYCYRADAIRDWLFSRNMIKCDENYYYSEEFGKCFSKKKKKVYLIKYNDKNILYNILKNISFISEIETGVPEDIPKMTIDFLKKYDCIIYDLLDGSYYVNTNKKDEIKSYLKSGGSFLVTHDKWDSDEGPLELIGLKKEIFEDTGITGSNKAKVSRHGHSIFDCYHDLTDWRVIDIEKTHRSHHIVKNDTQNTARVVMEFDNNLETGIKFDYLTVNEIGNGRIAYWAAGHHSQISEDEKKLFVNIVSWLTKIKQ